MNPCTVLLLASALMAEHPGMGVWWSIDETDSPVVTTLTAGGHVDFQFTCTDGSQPVTSLAPDGYVHVKCGVPVS